MCGDEEFSIDEWNETFHALELTDMSEREKDEILHPEILGTCDEQCFDCMAIVGRTRLRTKALVAKLKGD